MPGGFWRRTWLSNPSRALGTARQGPDRARVLEGREGQGDPKGSGIQVSHVCLFVLHGVGEINLILHHFHQSCFLERLGGTLQFAF